MLNKKLCWVSWAITTNKITKKIKSIIYVLSVIRFRGGSVIN
jgi:hypothetical protein